MNKEKHETALNAMVDLMQSELESDDRLRFSRVHRLSVLAQKLQNEANPRARDIGGRHVGNYQMQMMPGGADFEDIGGEVIGGAPVEAFRPGDDANQLVREMMPILKGLNGQNEAKAREWWARELNELLDARDRLQHGAHPDEAAAAQLTKRINTLIDKMGQREEDPDARAKVHMVPALDVRRHLTGEGDGHDDAPHPGRPLADGEGGGAVSVPEGTEAGGAAAGLGDGVAPGGDRSREHEGTDRDAGRSDLTSAGLPQEEAQVAPEANLGGTLHERPDGGGDRGDAAGHRLPGRAYGVGFFDDHDIREED